jgi:hypothetical protein
MNAADSVATGVFYGYFKTFMAVARPPPQQKLRFSSTISGVLD